MKKLFLLFAAAMLTVSVSAQEKTAAFNKACDNWYIGANLGVATPITDFSWGGDRLEGLVPKFSLRAGKNLTTVFGLALESDLYFGGAEGSWMDQKTMIDAINVDLLGTFNLNNALYGYLGQPRPFEVIAVIGGGYRHLFGYGNHGSLSGWNGKAGLDLTFNLGEEKAWQLYIEPAVVLGYPRPSWRPIDRIHYNHGDKAYNALIQLSVGMIYKFGNSNGSHNYKIMQVNDQVDLDGQYTQK